MLTRMTLQARKSVSAGTLATLKTFGSRNNHSHSHQHHVHKELSPIKEDTFLPIFRGTNNAARLSGPASILLPNLPQRLWKPFGIMALKRAKRIYGTLEANTSNTCGYGRGSEEGYPSSFDKYDQDEMRGDKLAISMVDEYNKTKKPIGPNEVAANIKNNYLYLLVNCPSLIFSKDFHKFSADLQKLYPTCNFPKGFFNESSGKFFHLTPKGETHPFEFPEGMDVATAYDAPKQHDSHRRRFEAESKGHHNRS